MKALLSWLKEFAPFEDSPQAIADDLAELGLSVEEMNTLGSNFSGIVVGRVLNLMPHPDADRIQLVEVEAGDSESIQVCCGAFNMSVGDLVPLAKTGAVLPNGMEISRRKLRGQWSEGMLCSADELELGADTGGIMILPQGLNLGQDLSSALDISSDTLFDIEVNPNRPDAMSILGIARDLAAKQGLSFNIPRPRIQESGTSTAEQIGIQIQDPDFCGHFSARVLTGVEMGKSPSHIAGRLIACGMRPINSIVDISNYVMLELGQPTHPFDLDKLKGGSIGARMAKDGESLKTLDGEVRELSSEDGVVVDGENSAISIAGVMGGASTEISDATSRVLVEAAWWKPVSIARSSRSMGLRSEASARFERGVDTKLAPLALDRIAELAQQMGARVSPGINAEYGNLPEAPRIKLRIPQIERQLGVEINPKEAGRLLKSIGFQAKPRKWRRKSELEVKVPSFRLDTSTEIDLIEEIARTHGYNRIPRSMARPKTAGGLSLRQRRRRQTADNLKGFGLIESISLPFLSSEDLEQTGISAEGLFITNNAVTQESLLRTSLRPGILKSLAYNASHQNTGVSLFEIGKIFQKGTEELPLERESLAIALAGESALTLSAKVGGLFKSLGIQFRIQNQKNLAGLHPVRGAEVFLEDKNGESTKLGIMGEVDSAVCSAFNIEETVAVAELDLDLLLDLNTQRSSYIAPSRYPSSNFDLAFWVDFEISAEQLSNALLSAAGEFKEIETVKVDLFDVFKEKNEEDTVLRRSLAYRIKLQSSHRTLTDKETAQVRESCIASARALGAEPRI